MQERLKKLTRDGDDVADTFDLDDLLHPAQAWHGSMNPVGSVRRRNMAVRRFDA